MNYLHEQDINCAITYSDMALYGPQMIVTDVDSTFITEEVIELLAEVAGSEDMVRELTTRAMRGELDFVESLAQRVATLRGMPASAFEDIAANITLTEGADRLVRTAHENGARFTLVSGGFHEVADLIAEPLGVDAILANRLEVAGGVLTGKTVGTIIDREVKKSAVQSWAHDFDVPLNRVVAAGDGANDLGMMSVAGLSVAFCAKPVVREQADSFISFPRLDAIAALVGWETTE
ncbi:MAG: phosphoserine phosphatase SerB [Actinomycetaceae bacterium]|nr:phosphoserine phosphatase SerB [Actinomycetaceae bacterium]